MVHLLRELATEQQIKQMLETHETYIKVAVDVETGDLAGGGEFHANCEAVLVEEGSRKENVWGADWIPDTKEVRFGSLINIRGRLNRGMEIADPKLRERVEGIIRRLFDR